MIRDSAAGERALGWERRIGRSLIAVTLVAVALLVVGVVLMAARGIEPESGGPRLDLPGLVTQVASLEPAGYLWLGLLAVIAAPIVRVLIATIAYVREGDRLMVGVSIGILLVIAIGIAAALTATV